MDERTRLFEAAWNRFDQLRSEERYLSQMVANQVGTSIPKLYTSGDSFLLNPSQVGTTILSRMIETDDTVSSAFMFKNLMVLSKIGEYHHEESEIADFVNDFLSRMEGPTWQESLESQISSSGYGFSITEIVDGLDDELRQIPVRLPTYHPSTLAFETDQTGQITPMGVLQFVYQYSQWSNPNTVWPFDQYGYKIKNPFETPVDRPIAWRLPFFSQYGLVRIPRMKVIHHVSNVGQAFGNPYGKTAVRTAHLAWQLKVFVMKQAGIAVKRSAQPTLWATAPKGQQNVQYTKADGTVVIISPREALRQILADRETDDAVITGTEEDGYHLEALQNTANLDQIGNLISLLDTRIFRCFLLPNLVMSDGSAGNRALGDKHFEIVDFVAGEEAKKFSHRIVIDLIKPRIIANFGKQKNYGKFKERPANLEERERLAGIYERMTSGGYMSPAIEEDMKHVRSTLSLPETDANLFQIDRGAPPAEEPKGKSQIQVPGEGGGKTEEEEGATGKPGTEEPAA